ncbi:PREDICTED: uncharacterized protein LOC106149097, partial [Chinchilla lanigera]|uniref:uncharacterized protein LOC106149097 n=1 Tax=Chinchilla lanigera TaxID=34839 RepID=UPI0006977B54
MGPGRLAGGRSAWAVQPRERCGQEERAPAGIQKLASPLTWFCLLVPSSREQPPASSVDDKYCTKSLEKTPKFSLKHRTRVSAAWSPGPPERGRGTVPPGGRSLSIVCAFPGRGNKRLYKSKAAPGPEAARRAARSASPQCPRAPAALDVRQGHRSVDARARALVVLRQRVQPALRRGSRRVATFAGGQVHADHLAQVPGARRARMRGGRRAAAGLRLDQRAERAQRPRRRGRRRRRR